MANHEIKDMANNDYEDEFDENDEDLDIWSGFMWFLNSKPLDKSELEKRMRKVVSEDIIKGFKKYNLL